jgi:hypothetical protein
MVVDVFVQIFAVVTEQAYLRNGFAEQMGIARTMPARMAGETLAEIEGTMIPPVADAPSAMAPVTHLYAGIVCGHDSQRGVVAGGALFTVHATVNERNGSGNGKWVLRFEGAGAAPLGAYLADGRDSVEKESQRCVTAPLAA